MPKVKIKNRLIGENQPVFIVAELSANHCQKYDLAVKTIKAAKSAGAEAIKVQTFKPETITLNCKNHYFKIKGENPWRGQRLYDLYKKIYMPWEWQVRLKKLANKLGLLFFSSPFDRTAVDFLIKLKVPAFKVASYEITDIPLIEYLASKGKPVILSTGIATLKEIEEAIIACKRQKNKQIALLKCTSVYPTPFTEVNLRHLPTLAKKFKTVVGLSDHTQGISVSLAAVSQGAKIIERHFILNRKLPSVDRSFSLEPKEFSQMVRMIREVEAALGNFPYCLSKRAKKERRLRRSLFIVEKIKKGEIFTRDNVASIRPGDGLAPKYLKDVLGKKAKKDIKKGTPLDWNLISKLKSDRL